MVRAKITVEVKLPLDEVQHLAWHHEDPAVRRMARRALATEAIDTFSWRRFFYILMFAWFCIWSWKNTHVLVRATVRMCWIVYLLLRAVRRPRKHTGTAPVQFTT